MTINTRRGVVLVSLAILVGACSIVSPLPTNTRTGKVYDILIKEEGLQPVDLVLGIGDEVRFRNERIKPSYVFFFRDFVDELSCEKGFKMFWGNEEGAKVAPRESASLCFNRTGTVGFRVQFEPMGFGGIGGTPGEIEVPPSLAGAIVVK